MLRDPREAEVLPDPNELNGEEGVAVWRKLPEMVFVFLRRLPQNVVAYDQTLTSPVRIQATG